MNAEQWNRLYPVGTDVFVEDEGEEIHTRTCSPAWSLVMGGAMVGLEGLGPMCVSEVRPVKPKVAHLITHPFGLLERMPLAELLDMMAGHGVAKAASVFKNHDDQPVFAVVLLTGADIQDYLDAFDRVETRLAASAVSEKPADDYVKAVGQFKDRLRDAMKKSSISIRGLSNKVAPSEGTLRSYLRGDTYPDLPVMIEIALALGCSPAWLAIGDSKVQVAQAAVPQGWRLSRLALDQMEIITPAGEKHWVESNSDDQLELVLYALVEALLATAPTAPAGQPNADDAARERFRSVDLPHRDEAAIYRAALEQIARYPRNANEELGYPACRSIASEAIGEADLLIAKTVSAGEPSND